MIRLSFWAIRLLWRRGLSVPYRRQRSPQEKPRKKCLSSRRGRAYSAEARREEAACSTLNDVLIVVDVQRDFFHSGILASADNESLIAPLNRVVDQADSAEWHIVFARDWHPKSHWSFADWGTHCVRDTPGG